jgi:hypothetical protein
MVYFLFYKSADCRSGQSVTVIGTDNKHFIGTGGGTARVTESLRFKEKVFLDSGCSEFAGYCI